MLGVSLKITEPSEINFASVILVGFDTKLLFMNEIEILESTMCIADWTLALYGKLRSVRCS